MIKSKINLRELVFLIIPTKKPAGFFPSLSKKGSKAGELVNIVPTPLVCPK